MRRFSDIPGWVKIFFGIGIVATGVNILQTTTALGRQLKRPRVGQTPAPGSRDFVESLSRAIGVPVGRGAAVRLLNNGREFFPDLLKEIAGARSSVHIMTYIWRPGQISRQILDLLVEKAQEGVEVRILVDGIGSLVAPRTDFNRLRDAGGHVSFFGSLFSRHILHVFQRNHSRAFVIDGRVAYTGGITVADHWLGAADGPKHWRDTMVRLTGGMARALQENFVQLWAAADGTLLFDDQYFPASDGMEDEGDMLHLSLAHVPSHIVQPLRYLYWYSIKSARERIYITNAYFAPDRHLRRLLRGKAAAGLDVRLLLPGPHIDNVVVRWAAQGIYEELLECGVRIFEYQPTMLHTRQIVVDGVWSLIGSANMDIRSVKLNHENVIGIQDKELGGRLEEVFFEDCRHAKEIHLDAWRRRSLLVDARAHVSSLLKAQY